MTGTEAVPEPVPTLEPSALPPGLVPLIGPYLARQRWYAAGEEPGTLAVAESRSLRPAGDAALLWWALVDADGQRYQVLVGERPDGQPAEFLTGREGAVLGSADGSYFYDATADPELAVTLLPVVSGGAERAERVRPISAEQSNTSLVYDDRVILKVFRRLAEGPNPDVEITTALARGGFAHVARPVASWREGGRDLMFAQEFLAGGSEGWALALTSLRDFLSAATDDPAEAGGDFASEAGRLGRVTGELHLALAAEYGVDDAVLGAGGWARLVDDVQARLPGAFGEDAEAPPVAPVVARLRAVRAPGPAIRVHGDFHLGQVMRTDAGWYVLDFEGEPARDLEDRQQAASPLKDVTGMLRSIHYASRFALRERMDSELERLAERAEVWDAHNRQAFLAGYLETPGIERVLPADEALGAVMDGYELDKALYEVGYERSYRPDWVDIPADAVRAIAARLAGGSA